jgi:uncharacterized LabA/DUF88 family protein
MAFDHRTPRIAVLIDADNASPRIAGGLFEEVAKLGEASVRRIYGDFSAARSRGWADILAAYAIIPHQQFSNAPGKNASDIALVIDAMDLLHSGRFNAFCLVSSDSDFTRLAARIREQGLDVFGFGEQKTPERFRRACHRFFFTENLQSTAAAETLDGRSIHASLQPPAAAIPVLEKAIAQLENEDGWVHLAAIGSRLSALASDFDPRTYGFEKLSDLVRGTNAFDVERQDGTGFRVRTKQRKRSNVRKRSDGVSVG